MKKTIKVLGFIAIIAVIGLSMTNCIIDVSDSVPNAPYITGTWTSTSNTISWSSVSRASGYDIYRGNSSSNLSYLSSTSNTYYTDYTQYGWYYAVRAYNSAGSSGYSNVWNNVR